MKSNILYSDLGLALARGDAALWVGPDGLGPLGANRKLLTAQTWLGVWSESRESEFAEALENVWRELAAPRMVIEVPDLVEDALGEHFRFADFCPYFYLNGKGNGADRLTPIRREDCKRQKARYLESLKSSVLLICGYSDPDEVGHLIEREVGEYGAGLHLIVLADCTDEALARLKSGLSSHRSHMADRIVATEWSLSALLGAIEEKKSSLPAEPTIRVGSSSIPLRPLLRTQPPIDQDFIIVTEQDVRGPEAEESKEQMLADLLAGRQAAWRAFAHGLTWKRDIDQMKSVFDGLDRMRREDLAVYCLNIPTEPGAGTTVLLQQIAFEVAREGHPCLLHRPFGTELNYDLLRKFLTDLQYEGGAAKGMPPSIAVLIFDSPSVEGDTRSLLQDLPPRLARDGRRALIVRSIPVKSVSSATDPGFKRAYDVRIRGSVAQDWLSPLSASLGDHEQNDLADWAKDHFGQVGRAVSAASLDTIRNWNIDEEKVPLLICLYFILADDLRARAGLGKHLTDRLKKILPNETQSGEGDRGDDNRPLNREELLDALRKASALSPRFDDPAKAIRQDVAAVFITLAALGSLRVGAGRDVLDAIAGIPRERIHSVIALLEKHDLALTDLPVDGDFHNSVGAASRYDDRQAPLAFYTVKETVGLRHPAYGRLVLDWLRSGDGAEDRHMLAGNGQAAAFLECSANGATDIERRFRLLEPILKALQPNAPQASFAADLSVRFLRLQRREAGTEINQFQWANPHLIREAFSWLKEAVVRQSPVTLHSRGITRYKTCFGNVPMEECRKRYQQAEADFEMALELARRHESTEHPGNIITSLGLLYLGWADRARQEVDRQGGSDDEWRSVDTRVEKTLRDALRERRDSPYAGCGLARYLLARCKRALRPGTGVPPEQQAAFAQDLSEALELLQIEPEAYFAAEWTEIWRQAMELLSDIQAKLVIDGLKNRGDELGFALEAMRILDGRIPTDPSQDVGAIQAFNAANGILAEAKARGTKKKCPLADLLRYAIFSASAERLRSPAYDQRFKLLEPLVGTRYLDQPIWRFDFAMLAFQVGRYPEGSESFAWLRKNSRFFEVPKERSQLLADSPVTLRPMQVQFRIVFPGAEGERGSGRVEGPVRFRDPVPFSARSFASRGKGIAPGTVTKCFIRLNPAGPFAEPDAR